MASVVEQKPDFSARYGSEVEKQIAEATGRIRTHDLTLGGLTLASLVAVYAVGMILLDKYLNLAEWVRQLALVGFLAVFAGVGYFLVARPLRRRINPLYAAAAVERTIDDPKNSVTGYVEAQETGEVSASVKAAMSARAARAVGEADVNRAVDHRNLLIAGAVLVLFLLILTALFFVFRPTQFSSLVGRAFVPFSSDPIATRTQLTLVKPEPPDVTITSGQTVTVAVHVGGKVPSKDGPTRVRLLVRYNPADPTYEELPLEEGETTRDWQLQVPVDRVMNGFWYKVAAGDAETPEHRVAVRSLPRFTEFEAKFKYPAYTRKADDKTRDHDFRAYRGTKVTLAAKANREAKDGLMRFDAPGLAPVVGRPAANDPETLVFDFTVTEKTGYKLSMTTTGGEKFSDPRAYQIAVEPDNAPAVFITSPEVKPDEPERTLPANGLLEVNGTVGDDFGIDKVRLVLKVDGRQLPPLLAENGKSFRREADGTWPKDYAYKGSADFTKLPDEKGQKFEPREGMVVEYWLEAIDNCTEAKPQDGWGEKPQVGNVGRSRPQTVRLTPPKTAEGDKKQLDQTKQDRNAEEQQHNQQQQQKFNKEDRDQDKKDGDKKNGGKKEGTPKEGDKKDGDGAEGGRKESEPKPGEPEAKSKPDPKAGSKGSDTEPKQKGGMPPPKGDNKADPKTDPKQPADPKGGEGGMPDPGMKQPDGKQPEGKQPPDAKTPDGTQGGRKNDTNEGPKSDVPPPKGGTDAGMGERNPQPMDQAPPPKSADEKAVEKQADQIKKELDKDKRPEGEAKPNAAANPGERTDPAQPKPQPKDGPPKDSQAKEGPKPEGGNPMQKPGEKDQNAASESKPAGEVERPTDPSQPKPAPMEPNPKEPGKKGDAPPAERREEPLGAAPGQEKPEPKEPEPKKDSGQPGAKDPKEPKEPNKDPKSGSTGKPCENPSASNDPSGNPGSGGTPPKEDPTKPKKDPAAGAGEAKPKREPDRGQDRDPGDPKAGPGADDMKGDPNAGDAKPKGAPESAASKPAPKKDDMMAGSGAGKQPDASEPKPGPKDADGMNPKDPGSAAEPRGDKQQDPKGMGDAVERGMVRADQQNPPKGDRGEAKGKENDPTAAKDGKGAKGGKGSKEPPKPLSPEEMKKLEDAAKNLDNPDPNEQQKARDTLDKAIGEQNRKEMEKLQKDLKSEDMATRKAAEDKVKEMMKKAEEGRKNEAAGKGGQKDGMGEPKKDDVAGKDGFGQKKEGDNAGKKLSPEELAELAKKAGDLNSKDDKKRQEAEKALDDKIGEDARKKLQEEMAKQPPKNPSDPKETKDLRDKIEEFARNNPPGRGSTEDDIKNRGAGGNSESGEPLEDDPRNRAKTAQLQLEEFKKNQYNQDLLERLKMTPEEYQKFLNDFENRARRLQEEADEAERNPKPTTPAPAGDPSIKIGGGKVETREGGPKGAAGSGATFAPPGFEDAKKRFQEMAKPKK